jgi:hypothetical protein
MDKITELKTRQADLEKLLTNLPKTWKKTKQGECAKCFDYKEKPVIELQGDNKAVYRCQEHFDKYAVKEIEEELKAEIAKVMATLDFQEKLSKVTRYAQAKELVQAVQAILKRAKGHYGDPVKWNADELDKGLMLLRMLNKIRPKSSVFIDKGVAVNSDLFIGARHGQRANYYEDSERQIILTVLDQDERYKAIARAPLTIGQAERLRNLLTECIEHVRITNMMTRIQSRMKLELPREEQIEVEYDET